MHRVLEWVGRKDRHVVDVDAVAYRSDGTKASVKLSNLSDGGCRIDSAVEYRVGERLQIAMPRMGYVRVQVRWCAAGSAGAKFVIDSDF
jgi:hypothetical protein